MFERGVDHWAKRELDLTRRKLQIRDSLAAIEAAAGARLLDEENAESNGIADGALLVDLERAQAELRALAVAIVGCRGRRMEAIRSKRIASATAIRKEATGKEAEAAKIEARALELLAEISSVQGMTYPGAILSTNPQLGQFGIPKSAQLRIEAENLLARASQFEKDVPSGGVVDVENVTSSAELAIAVLTHESEGPTAQQILQWAEDVERTARAKSFEQFGVLPRRCRLVFVGSKINPEESTIIVPAFVKPIPGITMGTPVAGYDVAGATFRAKAEPSSESRFQ